MEQNLKVNGVTAKITMGDYCPSHIRENKNLNTFEKVVNYMTLNDVIYKSVNIDGKMHTFEISKTDEANDNEYENMMAINQIYPLPTAMYK